MLTISDRGETDVRAVKLQIAKLELCSNHGYMTFRGECHCAGEHGKYERFAIVGGEYGFLHSTSGDIRLWKSESGARRRLNSYAGRTPPARIHYSGDTNAEHGGHFYTLNCMHWHYANVVRIQPCSDAGGPDNLYWIESLSVNIPDVGSDRFNSALSVYGMGLENYKKMSRAARRHFLVDACLAYGLYDKHDSEVVQVGKMDEYNQIALDSFGPIEVTQTLRGGSSIRNYAYSVALGYCR